MWADRRCWHKDALIESEFARSHTVFAAIDASGKLARVPSVSF
jgi:hypothetical protein